MCLVYTEQYDRAITADALSRPSPKAGGDLCTRVLQGAGEGGLLDPGAVEALERVCGGAGLQGGAGICGCGDGQGHRAHSLRRDGRIPQSASIRSGAAGGEDRPAIPKPEGLGDGRRTRCRDAFPEGRRGVVAGFAILGKVHARHQSANGEELHRQPVRGSAQRHAGKGRAGHLAHQDAARLP